MEWDMTISMSMLRRNSYSSHKYSRCFDRNHRGFSLGPANGNSENDPQAHNYTLSGQWKGPGGKVFMGQDIGPGGSNRRKVLGVMVLVE